MYALNIVAWVWGMGFSAHRTESVRCAKLSLPSNPVAKLPVQCKSDCTCASVCICIKAGTLQLSQYAYILCVYRSVQTMDVYLHVNCRAVIP